MNKLEIFSIALLALVAGCKDDAPRLPSEVSAIFDDPLYEDAVWGLRVVDLETGRVVHERGGDRDFYIGSVRKVFSVGALLDELGPEHVRVTPVFARGAVDGEGVLDGELVLVASGDLTMGGRALPDGSLDVTDLDHNEANSLGNAILSSPDPLAGYASLAAQVASAGITRVSDVVIDDRLFEPFDFRGEFDVRPIFVNDDCVDVIVAPGEAGEPAEVSHRPVSQAFVVESSLATSAAGSAAAIELTPELPACIGSEGCEGSVEGTLPIDYVPDLLGEWPLVRTFRITQPQHFARTVFIEALEAAGVAVDAEAVADNPVEKLPGPQESLTGAVASLESAPLSEHARFILKVSYNIGADVALMLLALEEGVREMSAALAFERARLEAQLGAAEADFQFVDGSGGGETRAKSAVVTDWLAHMTASDAFESFYDALPLLGVDGSLAMFDEFAEDESLAGAVGSVRAKTGTYVVGSDEGLLVKGQAFAGYIEARSGKRYAYHLVVNDVPVESIEDLLRIIAHQARISALLYRDL